MHFLAVYTEDLLGKFKYVQHLEKPLPLIFQHQVRARVWILMFPFSSAFLCLFGSGSRGSSVCSRETTRNSRAKLEGVVCLEVSWGLFPNGYARRQHVRTSRWSEAWFRSSLVMWHNLCCFSSALIVTGTAHVLTASQVSGSSRASCWWACYGKLNYSFSAVDMTCGRSAP